MGFIDWICEPNAEVRGQHLDLLRAEEPVEVPTFDCPFCDASFKDTPALFEHTQLKHPLSLPLLSLDGALATSELVIRNSINGKSIGLQNCSRLEVATPDQGFQAIDENEFRLLISKQRCGRIRVRLWNERASDATHACSDHQLDFRIAAAGDLAEIEARFVETMRSHPISVASSKVFWEACRLPEGSTGARDYANALANYVIGLSIKQGHDKDAHLPFDEFKSKFMMALGVLGNFDAPLAFAVSHVIRFSLNDFSNWEQAEAAVPGLGAAARFFESPSRVMVGKPVPRRLALSHAAKCPVDDLTERIVDAALMVMEHRFSDPALATLLPPLMDWSPLPEYDRQKVRVLMATYLTGLGRMDEADAHLRALRSDLKFGTWAAAFLDR
jgi:hypothetical protein